VIRDRQKLLADQRTRRPGAKTGQHIIQIGGAPGAAVALKVAIFDGTRTDKRYTGHLKLDSGSDGDAIQFMFFNDTGVDDLLGDDDEVFVVKCPTWLESDSDWGDVETYGEKYVGIGGVRKADSPVIGVHDGGRTNKTYFGHIRKDDGSLGAAIRWKFPNDPGVDNLMGGGHVILIRAPSWDISDWAPGGDRYWASLTPWSACM